MTTAVLLNWKRPYHMPTIVAALRAVPIIEEIIIWDNSGRLPDVDGATVIQSKENVGTYGRYLAAQQAAHRTIYTQDDDYVVSNVMGLWGRFNGTKIVAGLSPGHYRTQAHKTPFIQLGWGSFHRREWMEDSVRKWVACYGVDDVLKSKFDRIYTVLAGVEKHDPVMGQFTALREDDGRPSDRTDKAIWVQPGHYKRVEEAVARAVELRDSIVEPGSL